MLRRTVLALLASGAVAAPTAGRAQGSGRPVVGLLSTRAASDSTGLFGAFRKGLGAIVDESRIELETRWAEGRYDRLPALAAELVARNPTVLVAIGGEPSALALKAAAGSTPMVFIVGGDPVKLGLVRSFSNPGGNATGFSLQFASVDAKRIDILREILPGARTLAVLFNPRFPGSAGVEQGIREILRPTGERLQILHASTDSEVDAALAALAADPPDGLLVTGDPFFDTRRAKIVSAVGRARIPAVYQNRDYAVDGGLVSFGLNLAEVNQQAGVYAGRIVRGVRPSDLPIVQPTKYELVFNLKTAASLGLAPPPLLLAQADEIIE